MSLFEFIQYFVSITEINIPPAELATEAFRRSVEMAKEETDYVYQDYLSAFETINTYEEAAGLIQANYVYYSIYVSVLIIVFSEKLKGVDLNEQQRTDLRALLKQVAPVLEE